MNSLKRTLILSLAQAFAIGSVVGYAAVAATEESPSPHPVAKGKPNLNQEQDRAIKKTTFKTVSMEGAQPIPNKEIGLFAILPSDKFTDEAVIKQIVVDPKCSGISVLVPWSRLQPEESKYSWEALDRILSLAQEQNKSVILRVETAGGAQDTPKWVYDAGAKSIQGPNDLQIPVCWDSVYAAKWANFVRALGERYDNNPALHSVGITGNGIGSGSALLPGGDAAQHKAMETQLKSEFKMTPHQVVQQWKYVADQFTGAFKIARLSFDADAPISGKSGQEMLDEISDYLIFRFGERVYLTRGNVGDTKHGYDQYKVLLKFHPDTLTGYELSSTFPSAEIKMLSKNCLDDGVSFVELPESLMHSQDASVISALDELRSRLGYQLVSQNVTLPHDIKSGAPIKAGFTFVNLGSAAPMRPIRKLDKDVAGSYKVQLELRDAGGNAVLQSLHTPSVPTNKWNSGAPITWDTELRTSKLQPGQYSVYMSLIEPETKRKLQILNASSSEKHAPETAVDVGTINVIAD